jgi:guanidinopropionase
VIQIGIRGSINHSDMWKFSHDSGMRVVYMEELFDKGWKWAAEEARKIVGTGKTYLSFDVDSLDPIFAPGTGTPESGGIMMIEAQRMIRALAGIDFIGADVVEVSPPFDVGTITAQNAANVLFEILCVLAPAVKKRKGG